MYPYIEGYWKYITSFLYAFFMISSAYMILMNPGIPSASYIKMVYRVRHNEVMNDSTSPNHYKWCSKCGIYTLKKDKVDHCSECNVCVFDYDHHCNFSGKCVGRYTYIMFYCFCFLAVTTLFAECGAFAFGMANHYSNNK